MITFQNRRKNHHLSLHQFIARFLSKENRIDDLSRLSIIGGFVVDHELYYTRFKVIEHEL